MRPPELFIYQDPAAKWWLVDEWHENQPPRTWNSRHHVALTPGEGSIALTLEQAVARLKRSYPGYLVFGTLPYTPEPRVYAGDPRRR